ncbi:uncharacterized protein LOC110846640 isoform X1 [Folsomia candida]|uniref:uncharacterized protein LOC110846640 isoform X1 n=2 Tax=Folsomia candida TaxID=158441 RepID=UPI000B909F17|nr:uncharacterized protein LOC110846640 isoform X1 [Folsomia candida]
MRFWFLITRVNNLLLRLFHTHCKYIQYHKKMESSGACIFTSAVLILLITSIGASPIANSNEYRIRSSLSDALSSEDYQNDALIFDPRDFNGPRLSRASRYPLWHRVKHSEKDAGNFDKEESTDAIAFQPTTGLQGRPRSYNRRPSASKLPNQLRFQNPIDLWRNVDQPNADGKSDEISNTNQEGYRLDDALVLESVPVPDDLILSDHNDQNIDEDDLLNQFFSHVKTTTVSPKYSTELHGKKSKEKHGKLQKIKISKDINRNNVLHSDISNDDDESEVAFLTFDSVIQRRQCASSYDVKDGKCKPRAKIN